MYDLFFQVKWYVMKKVAGSTQNSQEFHKLEITIMLWYIWDIIFIYFSFNQMKYLKKFMQWLKFKKMNNFYCFIKGIFKCNQQFYYWVPISEACIGYH